MCMRELPGAQALALVGRCLMAGHPASAEERKWTVVPYLWGAVTSLDAMVRDNKSDGLSIEIDMSMSGPQVGFAFRF